MLPIHHIAQNSSAEAALLILCCRLYLNTAAREDIIDFINSHEIQWHLAWKLAGAHGIRPIVYHVSASCEEVVPAPFLHRCRQKCMQIATANLDQLKVLYELINTLKQEGIIVVPYKGLVMGQRFYGSYTARETADIDLLIKPADFPQARRLLLRLGYRERMFYDERFESYFIRTNREYKLALDKSNGEQINIELQWQPLHNLMGVPLENDYLFQSLSSETLLDTPVPVLSVTNALLLVLAHHGVADVWRKLRHVLDLAVVVQRKGDSVDWETLQQQLPTLGIERFSSAGGHLSKALFGITLPIPHRISDNLKNDLVKDVLRYPLLSTEKTNITHLLRHLKLCDSIGDRIAFIRRYLLLWLKPNMRDIAQVHLPALLFPIYYAIRRFRFLCPPPKKY